MLGTNSSKCIEALSMAQHITNFHDYTTCTKEKCVLELEGTKTFGVLFKFHPCVYALYVCVHAQSCSTLGNSVACQAPLSMRFLRQEHWGGLSFPSPGDLPEPGTKLRSPALQTDSLPSEPPGKTTLPPKLPISNFNVMIDFQINSRVSRCLHEPGVQKRGPVWKCKSRNPCIYVIFRAKGLNEITQRLKTKKMSRLPRIESRGTLMFMGQGDGEEQEK